MITVGNLKTGSLKRAVRPRPPHTDAAHAGKGRTAEGHVRDSCHRDHGNTGRSIYTYSSVYIRIAVYTYMSGGPSVEWT